MIQGGDPLTRDAGKESQWGTGGAGPTSRPNSTTARTQRGVISMARSRRTPIPPAASFSFATATAPFLDRQYTAFGKLIKGDDVLTKIAGTPVGSGGPASEQAAEARGRHQRQNRSGRSVKRMSDQHSARARKPD